VIPGLKKIIVKNRHAGYIGQDGADGNRPGKNGGRMKWAWEGKGARRRLAGGVILAAVAVLARLALLSIIGPGTPFVTFYPAAMFAALFGGRVSGFTATGLLGLVALFWVLPGLSLAGFSNAGWLALAMFVLTGTLLSVMAESLRNARLRSARAEAEAALSAERCALNATISRLAAIVESSDDAIVGLSVGASSPAGTRARASSTATPRPRPWGATPPFCAAKPAPRT
jgi:K+-sensing histidine kinase KdpD